MRENDGPQLGEARRVRYSRPMVGGQAVNAWDYDLALGVHYSFEKALIANLQKYIADLQLLPEDFDMSVIKELVRKYRTTPDEPIHYAEHPTDELRDVLTNVVGDCQDLSEYGICILANSEDMIIQQSIDDTIEETYQAMEAAIHNLNTLHCLPGSEEIWVSDKQQEKIRLITMKELDETFSPDRYEAFSINMDTGKVELKPIIASARKDNNRNLVTVTNKMGAKVTVTTNHKMVTINKQTGELYKAVPDEIMSTIMPKGISLPKLDDTRIVISDYTDKTPRRDTPVAINSLKLTRDLAYLLGVYIGDGSVSGGSGMLLTVCEKIPTDTLVRLVRKVFGKHIEYRVYYMPDGVRVKTVSFSLGRYMCDALKNMCGHTAGTKHVPDFIVRAPKNIQREFLRGYNDTDGRHTTKYAEISSVSERLITEVNFLVHRLNETAVLSKASTRRAGYVSNYEYLNVISIAGNSARRLNLATVGLPKCEIPKYDLSYVRGLIGHSSKYIKRRKSKSVRYGELKDVIKYENRDDLTKYTRFYAVDIAEREYRNSGDEYVYDISVKDNENFMTRDCIFVSNSRAGSQVPFSSINFGTDTSDAGRLIIRKTLEAVDAGMGNGETAIFPISIFKVYDGINFKPGDPNYDLYRYAMEVTARRLFPNFVFGDAPFNYQYYKPGHPETEIVAMGHQTLYTTAHVKLQ